MIQLYESEEFVFEDEERWAVYDSSQHQEFFPDGDRNMFANDSENGRYSVCWFGESIELDNLVEPAGFCIIETGSVSTTVKIDGLREANISNDGTVALFNHNNQFFIFDSEGVKLYQESFNNDIMTTNISPDGEYAAVSTAGHDKAVHMFEPRNEQYLGRVENTGRYNVKYLNFTSNGGRWFIRTYNSIPNTREGGHLSRMTPIDEIPVEPRFDVTLMNGIGIILDSNDDIWHHVPENEVQEIESRLRIPGITLQSSCNMEVNPIKSYLIYHDVAELFEEAIDFCEQCRESAFVYPNEKEERSFNDWLDKYENSR